MKPSIYNPTTLLPHDLDTHNDVNISSPQDGDVLTYDDAASEWVNSPSSGGTWGSITGTLSAQTDLQSALDGKAATSHAHAAGDITSGVLAAARGGIGSGLTSGAIPYFDGTAAVDSVLSQSAGVVVLASTSWINLSNAGAPNTSQFGIGAESGAVRVQSGSGGATRFYQGSTCLLNSSSSGLAVGLGTTTSARHIESRDTNLQYRASYSDLVYCDWGVDNSDIASVVTAGAFRVARRDNGGRFLRVDVGHSSCYVYSATNLDLGGFNDVTIKSNNVTKLLANATGLGFHGRTPAASQELLAPLTDSTGGSASTTLSAISGSGADAAINNALASLVARITSLESKLVATTLVTQAT